MPPVSQQAPSAHDPDRFANSTKETTQRLLDSAITVFGELGFKAATISEIARRCELTTGAVYARWPDKRALFVAAVERASAQRMEVLAGNAGAPVDERLAMLAEHLLTSERDDVDNLWAEACANGSRDESIRSAIAYAQEMEADQIAQILDAGKQSGVIDPSLSTAALVFVCQSLGFGAQTVKHAQPPTRPLPTDGELADLMGRYISAIAPAP